jgi:putative transposase
MGALLRYLHDNNIGVDERFQREMLRLTLQALMEWDVSTFINAGHYERVNQRKTYRNGYRQRSLRSSVGEISLYIPKLRNGTYSPEFIRRAERAALKLAPEAFLGLLTPQDIAALCHNLSLPPLPLSESHQLLSTLAPLAKRFAKAPLDGQYETLWLDEIETSGYRTIYVAVGVRENERAELIGYENSVEKDWQGFIRDLQRRGLRDVPVVMSEPNMKILTAIGAAMPETDWQMGTLNALPHAEFITAYLLEDLLPVSPFVYEFVAVA